MKRLSRRTVLRGAGGVALALPLLEAMRPRMVQAQTATPRRVMFVFMPNGNDIKTRFTAKGETTYALGEFLKPLEPYRNEMLMLNGINKMLNLLSGAKGDNHQQGGAGLAPWKAGTGSFPVGGGKFTVGYVQGPSADYVIGERVQEKHKSVPHRHLVYRVGEKGNNIWSVCSHGGPVGQQNPISPETDPYRAYARLFSSYNFSAAGKADPLVLRKVAARQSALDLVIEEAKGLESRLGASDRSRIEQHLQSLRDIERSMQTPTETAVRAGCEKLNLGNPIDAYNDDNHAVVGDLFFKIGALAFACDLTRSINFAWHRNTSNRVYRNLGISEGHHDISHKTDAGSFDKIRKINRHLWTQNIKLHETLKSIPEGDGTVWDNTLVVHWNELSEGYNHDINDDLVVLTGGASKHFKMGRLMEFNKVATFSDLLVNVFHYMGFTDVKTFGEPILSKRNGPIAGLTA